MSSQSCSIDEDVNCTFQPAIFLDQPYVVASMCSGVAHPSYRRWVQIAWGHQPININVNPIHKKRSDEQCRKGQDVKQYPSQRFHVWFINLVKRKSLVRVTQDPLWSTGTTQSLFPDHFWYLVSKTGGHDVCLEDSFVSTSCITPSEVHCISLMHPTTLPPAFVLQLRSMGQML